MKLNTTIGGVLAAAIIILISVVLLLFSEISEVSFVMLFAISCVCGLAIAHSEKLQELDIKGVKLVLREIQERQDNIKERGKNKQNSYTVI